MIKIGSVPFLNVKPLIYPLEKNLVEHEFEILYSPPSNLSKMLLNKEIDMGLLPVAELLKNKNLSIVNNISISSFGKVDSVILLAKSDIKNIKTIAVDSRSRSSTGLLRVILETFNNLSPVYIPRDPGEGFLSGVEGGMLIGDIGLKQRYFPPTGYKVLDLGELWTQETGLPFVYAIYAVNDGVHLGKNLAALEKAKSIGQGAVKEIAAIESKNLGLNEEICLRYMTERIKYDLGEKEISGILAYAAFLCELEEIGDVHNMRIYSQ